RHDREPGAWRVERCGTSVAITFSVASQSMHRGPVGESAEPAPVTQGSGGRNRTGDGEAAARWEPPRKGGTAGHCRGEGMYDHRCICCRACTSLRRFCESRPKCRVFHPGNEFHRDNYSIVIHVDRMSGMSE